MIKRKLPYKEITAARTKERPCIIDPTKTAKTSRLVRKKREKVLGTNPQHDIDRR
jgi:hypothetical protein